MTGATQQGWNDNGDRLVFDGLKQVEKLVRKVLECSPKWRRQKYNDDEGNGGNDLYRMGDQS